MKVDSTFEFEKRRNIPVRYDRELVGATIQAMKRVQEIQKAREDRYYERRMKGVKAAEKAAHAVEIAQNIELVKPVMSRNTVEANVKEKVKAKEKSKKMELE
jgi:large subunit ribosomal protein L24e